MLFKREIKAPNFSTLAKSRDTFFSAGASAENVIHVAFAESDVYPIPSTVYPNLNTSRVRSSANKTIVSIHSWTNETGLGKGWSRLSLRNRKNLPVIQTRMVRRHKPESFRNCCPTKIGRKLIERIRKRILRTLVFCRLDTKFLAHPDSHLIVDTIRIRVPFRFHHANEPVNCLTILHNSIFETSRCLPQSDRI